MKTFKKILCMLCLLSIVLISTGGRNIICASGVSLEQEIQNKVADSNYDTEKGDSIKGSELIDAEGNIIEDTYTILTDDAKVKFLTDVISASDEYVDAGKCSVEDQQAWLDRQNVAGSEMLCVLMAGNKPEIDEAEDEETDITEFEVSETDKFNIIVGCVFSICSCVTFF